MNDRNVREAVALYAHGDVTETEAARIAGISRAQLRYYVRTSGVFASGPVSTDEPESSARSLD